MALELWRPRHWLSRTPFRERGSLVELTRMQRQMEEFFDRTMREWNPTAQVDAGPAIDVIDKKDEIVLRADLPGLDRKDIDIDIRDGMLVLRGERKEEREEREDAYYACERWAGSFMRSIPLPRGIDTEKIDAKFRNGVLEIHLPKSGEAVSRRVEIKTG